MTLTNEERRPAQDAASHLNRTADSTRDLAARARRHDHGVLVLAERRDGIVTSQVFADLAAAERKVWRTRERGLSASLQLVRLMPVWHVDLDELQVDRRRDDDVQHGGGAR